VYNLGEVSIEIRIGAAVAGYRIERVLGRGGMSVVYLASDIRLERKVALKLLAPELTEDEAFRARFIRESKAAASIDHPNILPIYGAGEASDILLHRDALRRRAGLGETDR
jgi:serine/threonine protein kinase